MECNRLAFGGVVASAGVYDAFSVLACEQGQCARGQAVGRQRSLCGRDYFYTRYRPARAIPPAATWICGRCGKR